MARAVADFMVETLKKAGVKRIYGVVGDSLNPRDVSNRPQGRSSELSNAFGDWIDHRVQLVTLVIQQKVVIPEVRTTHVPVKVLSL